MDVKGLGRRSFMLLGGNKKTDLCCEGFKDEV